MQKKIFAFFIILALLNTTVYAEGSLLEKLSGLRENLQKYVIAAPKPNMLQKIEIGRIFKAQREALQQEGQEIRTIAINARKEFRQQLTREQLLKIMDLHDEFAAQRPGVRAALLLKKLEPADRVQLLTLLRALWRGEAEEISQNLDNLHSFMQEKVRPIFVKELALTDEQQIALEKLATETRAKIKPKMESVIRKLYGIRKQVREVLNEEQRAYIEANRDKVFQEIVTFVHDL